MSGVCCGAHLRHAMPKLGRLSRCTVQQLRHKGERHRAPPAVKEKEKWIKKSQITQVTPVLTGKELEEFMKRVPVDDVWISVHYPMSRYKLADTIQMHRELASPEMQDNMDGLVVADMELDMSTKKKTKFLAGITGTVLFPHSFDDGIENRVIAFTKAKEDQEAALNEGATFVGGLDLVKQVERGDVRHDDYDHVVSNLDMMEEVATIKKHLKDHFPSRKKGTIGPDIAKLVTLYAKGRTFESTKESDAVARVSVSFGKLNMPDDQLKENFETLVDTVSALKSSLLSKFIKTVNIRCPPSLETFVLSDDEIVPSATVSQATETDDVADDDRNEEEELVQGLS